MGTTGGRRAGSIAKQGRVQDILEDFKWRYSSGTCSCSSTAKDAEWDLYRLMEAAVPNAPVFIEAFVNACSDVAAQVYEVPTASAIDRELSRHGVGFQLDGDRKTTQDGKTLSNHRSQANAIDAGRAEAKRDRVDLVTHGEDGRIRSKDSYECGCGKITCWNRTQKSLTCAW